MSRLSVAEQQELLRINASAVDELAALRARLAALEEGRVAAFVNLTELRRSAIAEDSKRHMVWPNGRCPCLLCCAISALEGGERK